MTTRRRSVGVFASLFGLARGGTETYTASLAQEMRSREWDVSIIAGRSYFRAVDPVSADLDTIYVPNLYELHEVNRYLPGKWGLPLWWLYHNHYKYGLRPHIRRWDMLHVHDFESADAVTTWRAGGQPVVLTLHGLPGKQARFGRALRHADCIVSPSKHVADLVKAHWGLQCELIPPGVDLDLFSPRDQGGARSRLGWAHEKVVLFVGRLVPVKNLDFLLEAFAVVHHNMPNTALCLVGDGILEQHLQRRARGLRLEAVVRFQGAVARRALPDFYCGADMLVLPSCFENAPLTVLEALACGCPVALSDRVTEMLRLFPSMPMFRHDSVESAAAVITEVLKSGRSAVAREELQPFSWAAIGSKYDKIYSSLLGSVP